MAEKLSITIGLEGGKELQRQLADIGKAGQQAFLEIQKAAEKAGGFTKLDPAQVVAFTDKLKSMGIVGEQAFNQISSALASATRTERLVGAVQAVENGFASLASGAAAFARALGPIGATAGLALGGIVKVAADAASAIHKADTEAIKLGISISKFDQLKQSFERAGFSAGAIADGITHAKEVIDKFNLDRVETLFKIASETADRSTSNFTRAVDMLKQMAQGLGTTAEGARAAQEALVKLGAANIAPDVSIGGVRLPELERMFIRLGVTVTDTAGTITQFVEKMRLLPDSTQRTADAITVFGQKAGVEFIQILRNGGIGLDEFMKKMGLLTQESANAANKAEQDWNRVGSAWERLKTTLGATLLVNVPTNLQSTLDAINALLVADNWVKWGQQASTAIGGVISQFDQLSLAAGDALWAGFKTAGQAAIDAIGASIDWLIGKIAAVAKAMRGIAAGGGEPGSVTPAPGNASGGYIRGPGTATSDSILARLSNGEFVVSARAVQHWGVGFLSSLNNLQTPRFSMGGLAQMPRFAAGGLVGGMPHLGTVDLTTNHGLVRVAVDDGGLKQLRKAAVMRNMGADRKPGWVR